MKNDGTNIPIITISREYGAGGRTIARGLSESLGIPWYDRDFVKLIAAESGYSQEDVFEESEEMSEGAKLLNSFLNNITAYASSYDKIFAAQKAAILELADKEPCIIVGRCANLILQDAGHPSFDIFLHASESAKITRTMEKCPKLSEDEARRLVKKKDEQRENYYKNYTKRAINIAQEYSVCLDTGALEYDTCIEALTTMIKHWHSRF